MTVSVPFLSARAASIWLFVVGDLLTTTVLHGDVSPIIPHLMAVAAISSGVHFLVEVIDAFAARGGGRVLALAFAARSLMNLRRGGGGRVLALASLLVEHWQTALL